MRRWSVKSRLAASLGVLSLVLLSVSGLAVAGLSSSARGTAKVGTALSLTHDAMQAKFRTADFAGWQTGYAFETLRGVPGAAEDGVGQRKEFLRSTGEFRKDLDRVAGYELTASEKASLDAAKTAFEKFMSTDATIDAGYRKGTPASIAASNSLASGRSLELFATVADRVDAVASSVTVRGEQVRKESIHSASGTRQQILLAAVLGLVVAVGFGIVVVLSVTRPVSALRRRMEEIADGDGDLTQRADESGRDELTAVGVAFNRFVGAIAVAVRSVGEQAFSLSAASQELSATSATISHNAREATDQASAAEDATAQIAGFVTSASSGAQEMSLSIREIAQNAASAAGVAAGAVSEAESTTAIVSKLGESSAQIGDVVKAIAAIAGQTNLLALNATIEAARAGEAGRGFAVVANEVKELSQETSRATEEISRRVQEIQVDTDAAVDAIVRIAAVIGEISEYQTTIAAAVEEQSATSQEMSRSVSQAAAGTDSIAENIRRVSAVSESTAAGVVQSQAAVDELSRMGSDLERVIDRFRV